jgi:hypothetical protein
MSLWHPIRSIQAPTELPLVIIVHANTDFPLGQTGMANASVDSCQGILLPIFFYVSRTILLLVYF